MGQRLAAAHEGHALRTFASRAVFSPTYTPPEKMIFTFFALASANSARLFFPPKPPAGQVFRQPESACMAVRDRHAGSACQKSPFGLFRQAAFRIAKSNFAA